MVLLRCCPQYASKFENSAATTGLTVKGQFSLQSQWKATPRNVQTTEQFALISQTSNIMLKILQARLNSTWTENFQMFKLDLEKVKEPEIKLPTSVGSLKKRIPEKHLLLLYWLHQSLWLCWSQQNVKNFERDGNTRPPDLPPEKSVCRSRSNS